MKMQIAGIAVIIRKLVPLYFRNQKLFRGAKIKGEGAPA